ncbi:MAG: hypothetical protein PHG14_03925 [Desulfobacter postgatei]|uniref:hypothetical protein n=1 Tax=Desulfobacter postgatei TaxID=2293 RepID=UPI0023F422E4|nr:hypothetical protein [Desulfobacter postgatei]MDD4272859.1 hypothetical protein [Desulfobacter postgatei]
MPGLKARSSAPHATKAPLPPMLRGAISFSSRFDARIRDMQARVDDLSWGVSMDYPKK